MMTLTPEDLPNQADEREPLTPSLVEAWLGFIVFWLFVGISDAADPLLHFKTPPGTHRTPES